MADKEKKSIVEEALLDINVIQEALKKNTKEILRSTMKEEIEELIKEHVINEQGYEEEDITSNDADDNDTEKIETGELDSEEENEKDNPATLPVSDDEEKTEAEMDYDELDLTAASDEEVIKVFKKLSADDEIEVVSDKEVNVKDPDSGNEYIVKVNDGKVRREDDTLDEPEMDTEDDLEIEIEDEPEMDDEDEPETDIEDESVEPVYEITLDEDIVRGQGHDTEAKETTTPNKGKIDGQKAPVDSKTSGDNLKGGFDEDNPNDGKDGHAEHVMESEEDENSEDEEIEENKSRALADLHANRIRPEGKKEYHTAPIGRADESVSKQKFNELLNVAKKLQTENKEIKNALSQFKKMLAESVVYNTNLTYMVKIITEHSTSKEEKKMIMQRFDEVKTLKESKALYKTIISELANKKSITESIENKIEKSKTSGASNQLTETTAYVDESTKRIKDLIKRVENR